MTRNIRFWLCVICVIVDAFLVFNPAMPQWQGYFILCMVLSAIGALLNYRNPDPK